MLRVRVIPCLLVRQGALVKTVKFENGEYIGDPINAVRIFNDYEVDELVFLDIDASKKGTDPDMTLISEIASECFMPVTYGGGVRTIEQMNQIYSIGIEKIAINSSAVDEPGIINQAAKRFGSQSLVVSIDVKKGMLKKKKVYQHRTGKLLGLNIVDWAKEAESRGAGELLINSVDRDGTWEGYDEEFISSITSAVNIPVVALGGAGILEDMKKAVKECNASGVAAGSMFVFQKKGLGVLINYPSRKTKEGLFR